MSKRSMDFKMPKHPKLPDSGLPESTGNVMNTVAKWVPLMCAGAAIGVSIIALKEIQNVRKELTLKKNVPDEELAKRLEIMELQLKKLSDFIMVPQNTAKQSPKKTPKVKVNVLEEVIKNAMNPPQTEMKIINENEKYDPTEYEEVEVTDDETE